jgi:hypothetical protein
MFEYSIIIKICIILTEKILTSLAVSLELQGIHLRNTQYKFQHSNDSFKYLHEYKIYMQYEQLLCKVIGPHQCTIPENKMYWDVFDVNKMLGLHCQGVLSFLSSSEILEFRTHCGVLVTSEDSSSHIDTHLHLFIGVCG